MFGSDSRYFEVTSKHILNDPAIIVVCWFIVLRNVCIYNVGFIPRANETHTHAEAQSQEDLDRCVEQGLVYDSTVIVTLDNRLGRRYFMCTDGNHCNMGMKFAIDVLPKPGTTSNTAIKVDSLPILLFITIMANLFLFFV